MCNERSHLTNGDWREATSVVDRALYIDSAVGVDLAAVARRTGLSFESLVDDVYPVVKSAEGVSVPKPRHEVF